MYSCSLFCLYIYYVVKYAVAFLCVSSKCIVTEVDVFQVLVMCIADRKVINAVRFRRYYVQIEQRQDMANQEHQFPQEWKRLQP